MTLKMKNVSKSYQDGLVERVVLSNLSVVFPKKGLVFILGKSGSGKSTMVNLIAGITKPSEGVVELNGTTIAKIAHYRRNHIALVYQNINLVSCLDLEQNCILACKIKGRRFDKLRYNQLISQLELDGLDHRYPSELSGGQCQRASLVRSLVCAMPIIILDEPTGSCDNHSARLIMKTLARCQKKQLIIIVTHDRSLVTGTMVIDFETLQPSYDFSRERYSIIASVARSSHLPGRYWLAQFHADRGKYLLLLASQIIIAITVVVMIISFIAFRDYFARIDRSVPGKNIITIEKVAGVFAAGEIDELIAKYELEGAYGKIDLNAFNLQVANENIDVLTQSLASSNPELKVIAGRPIAATGEILVNQAYTTSQDQDIPVAVTLLDRYLTVVGTIEDGYNNYPTIYFDYRFLGFSSPDNQAVLELVLTSQDQDQLVRELEQDYLVTSHYQEVTGSYANLVNLGFISAGALILIALIIGAILYGLVLETIFYGRIQVSGLLLSLGQTKLALQVQQGFEIILMTSAITVMALFGSIGAVALVNYYDLPRRMFGIAVVLDLQSNLTWAAGGLGLTYLAVGLIAALASLKALVKLELSEVLKEE